MYQEYFNISEDEEKTEEKQIEEKEETLPEEEVVEEKKSDVVDALEAMSIGLEELPPDWSKDKVLQVLKERRAEEKAAEELAAKKKADEALDTEQKRQVRILKGGRYPEQKINYLDSPEEVARKEAHNKRADEYKKAVSDYDQQKSDDLRRDFPKVAQPKKNLRDMTMEERAEFFEKLGLMKDHRPPQAK